MAKWTLAVGAAALALTAPALAAPDKDKGGGKGGQKAERGDRGGNGGGKRAERGRSGGDQAERRMARADRGDDGRKAERKQARAARGDDDRGERAVRRMARADRDDGKAARVERRDDKGDRRARRSARADERREGRDVRFGDARGREFRPLRPRDDERRFAGFDDGRRVRGFADDCPPGLAKKGNGCLPPGQAKRMIGAALPVALGSQLLEGPYRQWYRDNDRYYYRDDGDFIYRVNRQGGLVDALFPFQDRDYRYYDVGTAYPADYNFYNVPQQYQSYYADGSDYNYRYGDGAIYQVNRSDNMINSIVALLAGDLAVGRQLPADYGVYNVPMAYRDRYYDTPEALYRYNDGYIYQADAKTQLITAVIDALV